MTRAHFVFLPIDESLEGVTNDATSVQEFTIDGTPTGTGYLLIQATDVQAAGHRIVINDKDLPGVDIPPHPAANVMQTWMDRIPPGFLRKGENRIQIRKQNGADKFRVGGVSVNWREND